MAKQHRRFEPADKIKILREHLLEGKPLSEVCEQHSIAPTQFYQWQKVFFENGAAAFAPKKPGREYELEHKVKQLTKKLAHKGTFYYMCTILDGFSRYIVHWDIRESMTEADVEIILQRARENFPDARPRIISDNGPQFISRDFREFVRISGMTHVKTSPYYPRSNGKLERYHKTIKGTCIRVHTPLSLQDAIEIVTEFVSHYNTRRLHSAIGYVTPKDKLEGRAEAILAARDAKLAAAREARKALRKAS
jgi:transposase-like protein